MKSLILSLAVIGLVAPLASVAQSTGENKSPDVSGATNTTPTNVRQGDRTEPSSVVTSNKTPGSTTSSKVAPQ